MRTTLIVVVVLLMCSQLTGDTIWEISPINGHSYTLVDSPSWTDAESQATALGGHLATIRSNAENDWVYQFALANKASCYRLWIGANKPTDASGSAPNYGWTWSSEETMTYTNWVTWFDPSGCENQAAYMFVRYWDVTDEEVTRWGPENFGGIPGNPVYTTGIVEVTTDTIPEPATALAFGAGLVGLLLLRRRRGP